MLSTFGCVAPLRSAAATIEKYQYRCKFRETYEHGTELVFCKAAQLIGPCQCGLKYSIRFFNPEFFMPKKIRVEADICAPKPVPPNGFTTTTGRGQKVSLERGTATRSKKNPGKRPKKGG